jgi:hypothetical protein
MTSSTESNSDLLDAINEIVDGHDSEKSNSSDDDALKENIIIWPEPRPEQSEVEEWNLDGEPYELR